VTQGSFDTFAATRKDECKADFAAIARSSVNDGCKLQSGPSLAALSKHCFGFQLAQETASWIGWHTVWASWETNVFAKTTVIPNFG
jgi:hypothetical protein